MIGIRQKVIISENTIWSTEQTWAFEEIVQIPCCGLVFAKKILSEVLSE